MHGVSTEQGRRSRGDVDDRIGFWAKKELARRFREAADARGVELSDVLRNAMLAFVIQYEQEKASGPKAKKQALARRMFRVLLSVMDPKKVLEEVLALLPSREVDKIINAHRGEKT